jgi:hypothetical protein
VALPCGRVEPQLSAIIEDLQAAVQRLDTLRSMVSDAAWTHRPGVARWSPAECVAHLNLTSQALIPVLRVGLEQASTEARAGSRYRRDLVGWVIWKVIAPSTRLRTRTVPAFMPSGEGSPAEILADFKRLQSDIIACVRSAEGRAIDHVKLASPYDARVRYNLYAALTLVPRHQHRHLLQAERAARVVPEASALAG